MKKLFILFSAFIFSILSINAQTAVQTSKFFDNWSIGIDGGVNTNLHYWDNVGGVVGLQITKGITPVLSLEFSSQVGLDDLVWDGDGTSWNKFGNNHHISTINALGSVKVNLMNWFGGYLGRPRVFEIQARGGIGYQRALNPVYTDRQNSFVGKTGLDFDFNIGKQHAWTASVRPAVLWNHREYGNKARLATAQVTAGITYHFKNSNGTHYFKTYDIEAMQYEISRLQSELDKKPTEVIVERPVERVVIKEVIDTVYVNMNEDTFVFFRQNSDILTAEAREKLKTVKGTVCVTATASPEGDANYNKRLSQRRANAVKEFLESHGVTVESAEGLGVVNNESGRVAIVTVK